MTILNILKYPDERLYKVAREVKVVNKEIKTLISNMAETMYEAPGIGLAATQVDFHQRIIIIDISEDKNNLLVLINPILLESKGEEFNQEGCLSVPEVFEKVKRAEWIKISAIDINGKKFELEADGLLAVCIQHEMII